jgi:ubiquinone/menaquinone biosynthesis C-methylase UbiE
MPSRVSAAPATAGRGAAEHLGISLREYDRRIRTFIPRYEEMLDAAAAALTALSRPRPLVVDLGTGSGALAARSLAALPHSGRIIGIDSDSGMLAMARRRLRRRFTTVMADFQNVTLPRCDAVTASLALHHIAGRRGKSALYKRCFDALRPGGFLVNADCCPARAAQLQKRDRDMWFQHLRRRYSASRAAAFFREWAREDVYFPLEAEMAMLRAAGFDVDVPWRRESFAVVVGTKPAARGCRASR